MGLESKMMLHFPWEEAFDPKTQRIYYVNHANKITTWLNPINDRFKSVEQCTGDELPYGWEKMVDPKVGTYFTDHLRKRNQWDNPVLEWRLNKSRQAANNQHHYSNSQHLRLLEQNSANQLNNNTTNNNNSNNGNYNNIINTNGSHNDNNTNTTTAMQAPTTTDLSTYSNSKHDTSLGRTSDGITENKSATTSFGTENTNRNYSTVNSKYDAGLLDIMDNCFSRGSSQSVEV